MRHVKFNVISFSKNQRRKVILKCYSRQIESDESLNNNFSCLFLSIYLFFFFRQILKPECLGLQIENQLNNSVL